MAERAVFALRFWVVDNSGSMSTNDGTIVSSGQPKRCTRWAELRETVAWHAKLAHLLHAPTEFRLLNAVSGVHQNVIVGAPSAPTAPEKTKNGNGGELVQGTAVDA